MGAPLAGSEVRAYVMTGGGMRFKGWWPRYRARRVQMIFPLKGTDKRGLVSLEAKKRQARKDLSLLQALQTCHELALCTRSTRAIVQINDGTLILS